MQNIHCELNVETKVLRVYRGTQFMGFVTDLENDNNPSMEIFANRDGLAYLSLNDMEIIQDNWNMLLEGIENKGVKKNNEKVVDKNKEF